MNDTHINTQVLQGLQQLAQMVQDPNAQQLIKQLIQLQTQDVQEDQGQGQAPQQGAPSQGDLLQSLTQRR